MPVVRHLPLHLLALAQLTQAKVEDDRGSEPVPGLPPGDLIINLYPPPVLRHVKVAVRDNPRELAPQAAGRIAPEPPIVKRCPGFPEGTICGVRISNNARCCHACNIERLKKFAPEIKNADDLEKIFRGMDQDTIDKVMVDLRPLLSFDPDAAPTEDCPKCGYRRGTILPHECASE